jgi:hypothetical protein
VAGEFDQTPESIIEGTRRDAMYDVVVQALRATPLPPTRLRKSDLLGGFASGLLVFACSFPAAVSFMLVDDPGLALRISNSVLLTLLFVVGYRAARYTLARPWIAGARFVLGGMLLVLVAIALGG